MEKYNDESEKEILMNNKMFIGGIAVNTNGGNCSVIELPKIGIYGNTHFLMQDLNNDKLADLLNKWLRKNKLK